jgi:hypothetical protein
MARPLPNLTAPEVCEFISKIRFSSSDDCWMFGTQRGYGRFTVAGASYVASRVSLRIFAGFDPMEKVVCHKCDRPPCVNPTHLYAGTDSDNQRDYQLRGKFKKQPVLRAKYLKYPLHPDFLTAADKESQ